MILSSLIESDAAIYDVQTSAAGPSGSLPLTEELLHHAPSGDLFGWSQDVGMGWNPAELHRKEFLILSTQGGIRAADGSPVALGYHTDGDVAVSDNAADLLALHHKDVADVRGTHRPSGIGDRRGRGEGGRARGHDLSYALLHAFSPFA